MTHDHEINILLVEDNEGDIRLAKEALSGSEVKNRLSVVRNGEDALDFLQQEGAFKNEPAPDLILLDLNLPKIDGREVLKKIKNDKNLKKIPVVILTTSSSHDDIIATYSDHANSFITKPLDWEQFMSVVKSIENFWLSTVKLPGNNGKQ